MPAETEVIAAPAFDPVGRNLLGTEASKEPAVKGPIKCTKQKGPLGELLGPMHQDVIDHDNVWRS